VREARRYRRSGSMSVRDLARRYGVSEMTVYRAAG
jgi:DeoR/GlpR family transcriptional regulator of sugar metabolism